MKKESGATKWAKRLAAHGNKDRVDKAKEVFVRDEPEDEAEQPPKHDKQAGVELAKQRKDPEEKNVGQGRQ